VAIARKRRKELNAERESAAKKSTLERKTLVLGYTLGYPIVSFMGEHDS
jgi:hypothetical protein